MSTAVPTLSLKVRKPSSAHISACCATRCGAPALSVALHSTGAGVFLAPNSQATGPDPFLADRSSWAVRTAHLAGGDIIAGSHRLPLARAASPHDSSSATTVSMVVPPRSESGTASPRPSTPSSSRTRSSTISRRSSVPRAVAYGSLNGSA
jgi:hypothetical protein